MTETAVTTELVGHVATVEVHRPPHNWFDIPVMTELADAILAIDEVPECRAIVLCSEGKNFSAGANLSGTGIIEETARLYQQAVRLFTNRKPIVAAVQGAAVGGGLGLALVADFRVASAETRFTCNFAQIGFHPGFGISVTLPTVVGQQRALDLMYTGRPVRGEEAVTIGLADRLATNDDLRKVAQSFAAEIATSAPLSLLAIRETIRGDLAAHVRAATGREHAAQERLRITDDFREGVEATSERRPPRFSGR